MKKIYKSANILTILFLAFFFMSCKSSIERNNLSKYKSSPKVYYVNQNSKDNSNFEESAINVLVLDNDTTISLIYDISPRYGLKVSESGRFLAMYNDKSLHYGAFKVYDLYLNKNWHIELKNLEGKLGPLGITDFGFWNDSTIMFSAINNLYLFSIYEDRIRLFKSSMDKLIYKIIINSTAQEVAFSYFSDYSSFDNTFLAVLKNDTIHYSEFPISYFGNWNKDNDELTCIKLPNIAFVYYDKLDTIENIELDNVLSKEITQVLFLSNDTLLVNISSDNYTAANLFLYNYMNHKLLKQLTFDSTPNYHLAIVNAVSE